MDSIKLKSHIGKDGILQVQVPDDLRDQELEIMVIFQPIISSKDSKESPSNQDLDTPESRGWSPGFFENVVGSWEGEPLERSPQLPYGVL